jgi:hypothetical protein
MVTVSNGIGQTGHEEKKSPLDRFAESFEEGD